MRVRLLGSVGALVLMMFPVSAADPDPRDWRSVLTAARGQTVYFHAWGGETRINDYIAWAGAEAQKRFGITVQHVKVAETAAVVARVLAEKTAGRTEGGSVDLVWINGENFAAMKTAGLLRKSAWATALPNWRHVDVEGKPTVTNDFNLATEGLESPWGMAQLTFYADSARTPRPPATLDALVAFAAAHPGRFTYPQPPDFLGTTFLKQVLVTRVGDKAALGRPLDPTEAEARLKPVFETLEVLHPFLWRQGRAFPANVAALRRLFADGEIDIGFTFNPGDASTAIRSGELPATVRSFTLDGGTLGNTHFVAIPFNASAAAGAMVFADFLLSPEAQARKQDPNVWGDPTVLAVGTLDPPDRARFEALDLGPATLKPGELGPALPEPHPSWSTALAAAWARRYAAR